MRALDYHIVVKIFIRLLGLGEVNMSDFITRRRGAELLVKYDSMRVCADCMIR